MKRKSEWYRHLSVALEAGQKASAAILEVYAGGFSVEDKADGSPITQADRRSNDILTRALSETSIPVISEETRIEDYSLRRHWDYFWLVDPLDGTKEFISRNGEFAINIALMHKNEPLLGIIIAPVKGEAWWGIAGEGAFKLQDISQPGIFKEDNLLRESIPLKPSPGGHRISISVSRSHMEEQTMRLIGQIREKIGPVDLVEKGSALKFGDLVEGRSDLYIRYSPTWEWDTAAGHALLRARGGELLHITQHKPLEYNKPRLENPGFIAFARKEDLARYLDELAF